MKEISADYLVGLEKRNDGFYMNVETQFRGGRSGTAYITTIRVPTRGESGRGKVVYNTKLDIATFYKEEISENDMIKGDPFPKIPESRVMLFSGLKKIAEKSYLNADAIMQIDELIMNKIECVKAYPVYLGIRDISVQDELFDKISKIHQIDGKNYNDNKNKFMLGYYPILEDITIKIPSLYKKEPKNDENSELVNKGEFEITIPVAIQSLDIIVKKYNRQG